MQFKKSWLLLTLAALCVVLAPTAALASEGVPLGERLPLWSIIPFVGMLLSIAIFPLVNAHWWEANQGKVAAFWSLVFIVPFTIVYGWRESVYQLYHSILLDYIPFIILLFGLFCVAGGIVLRGNLRGSTKVNVIILLIGSIIASWIGTTGAAMLLIRPLIRANNWRKYKVHTIVFFIFTVCNIGGSLTPVGDPPLFMGFLRGVPFFWTTIHLLLPYVMNIAALLLVYVLLDRHFYKKEITEGNDKSSGVADEGALR